jgi:hypothetical protein
MKDIVAEVIIMKMKYAAWTEGESWIKFHRAFPVFALTALHCK